MFLPACRYIDDIFLTTNLSADEIVIQLEKAKHKDMNIDIDYQIRFSADFLDVQVANENGHLITKIFHKPSAEPYIVPYSSDHPHHVHRNVPYAALLRAVRLCSSVHDFDMERIRIDLTLLLNEYPPHFISKQFERFFRLNNAEIIHTRLAEDLYGQLHHRLLHEPSRREKRLSTMIKDHDVLPTVLQRKIWNTKLMYPRFTYESGPIRQLKPAIHHWWKKWYRYPGSLVNDVRLRVCNNTNPTLEDEFVHKKPSRNLLT